MHKQGVRILGISLVAMLVALLGCSADTDSLATPGASSNDNYDLAKMVAEAHGGLQQWNALSTLSIDRVHHMFRDAEPFHFQIVGDYATGRIYQHWTKPTGLVVWDGERAWSNDWEFEDRFSARFTTAIGFYLANMPWLLLDPETKVLGTRKNVAAIPGSEKQYTVLDIEFEAAPVRKPRAFQGIRDSFGIVIDPDGHRIAAIIERRSYAGQLDTAGAPADQTRFENIFVIDSHVEAGGLLWPNQYSLYTLEGQKYGEGVFHNYVVNVPFDEQMMHPLVGDKASRFDNTSSYSRVGDNTLSQ